MATQKEDSLEDTCGGRWWGASTTTRPGIPHREVVSRSTSQQQCAAQILTRTVDSTVWWARPTSAPSSVSPYPPIHQNPPNFKPTTRLASRVWFSSNAFRKIESKYHHVRDVIFNSYCFTVDLWTRYHITPFPLILILCLYFKIMGWQERNFGLHQ